MKKCLPILLAIVLTACTAAPTPTPTATATYTPAASPTPTLTPTATPDPNMPQGAMGKNGDGEWVKSVYEDGRQVIYTWKELRLDNEEGNTISAWFTSHIVDGPYNLDSGIPLALEKWYQPHPSVPFHFDVMQGVDGPYLRHPKQILEGRGGAAVADFQDIFMAQLIGHYYRNPLTRTSGPSTEEYLAFLEKLHKNAISFPFVTHTGSFAWKPGPHTGYEFYVIPWDEADPARHAEFYQTHFFTGLKGDPYLYRWALYADDDGNLICVGAVKEANALSANQFFTWIFDPVVAVLVDYSMPDIW